MIRHHNGFRQNVYAKSRIAENPSGIFVEVVIRRLYRASRVGSDRTFPCLSVAALEWSLMRYSSLFIAGLLAGSMSGFAGASVVENYDGGTDLGIWCLTTNLTKPRVIQPSGGSPGKFLEQDQVAGGKPEWATADPLWAPGFSDDYKNFSPYTGNFA